MTDTIAQLMQANLLEVFNERDASRRRAAIARIYADDIRWTDDDGEVTGHAAVEAKASDLQRQLGNLQFVPASPVYQTIGLGYLAFHLVAPGDDSPQISGFDVALIRDDVIVHLYTVLTRPPG